LLFKSVSQPEIAKKSIKTSLVFELCPLRLLRTFRFFWRSQHLSVICLHTYRASTSFVGFVAYFFSFVAYVACAALDGNHALALYVRYEVGPKCGIDKHLKVCANVIGKNRMSFLLTQTSLVSSVFNERGKDS